MNHFDDDDCLIDYLKIKESIEQRKKMNEIQYRQESNFSFSSIHHHHDQLMMFLSFVAVMITRMKLFSLMFPLKKMARIEKKILFPQKNSERNFFFLCHQAK